jgi:hypothetical protein
LTPPHLRGLEGPRIVGEQPRESGFVPGLDIRKAIGDSDAACVVLVFPLE